MTTIKIISNPYLKEVKYQILNKKNEKWEFIQNGQSDLLSESLATCFLPFKSKEILDVIFKEYDKEGEKIEVQFEGPDDEFQELLSIVDDEYVDKINLIKSNVKLENARDILPEVKKLFGDITILISECQTREQTAQDIERFSDASSDVVPICIIGNYSAGKSTFINSLVGCELLPSATEPSTSKVYRISKSKNKDRASIKCSYKDNIITIYFNDESIKIESSSNNELAEKLKNELSNIDEDKLSRKVNKALNIINYYDVEESDSLIDDMIEVSIPFSKGVLSDSQHPFVIFDTPGSNSASNSKHLAVLKKAMKNMTNGLPIFLCEPDALDSTDNEKLYDIITEMENELDRRFTMIVVNKADESHQGRKIDKQHQEKVLSQAVPKRLYAGGLFYASSIMGLGSKTEGSFVDDDYDYIYSSHKKQFDDQADRHYMSLYYLDILPIQIKKKLEQQAVQHSNLIYANSGLYTIESAIETFAGKYAAYNKCTQSKIFLNKVIEETKKRIEEEKEQAEVIKNQLSDNLDEKRKKLLNTLNEAAEDTSDDLEFNYPLFMDNILKGNEGKLDIDYFKNIELEFTDKERNSLSYNDKIKNKENAFSEIGRAFKEDISDVWHSTVEMLQDIDDMNNVSRAIKETANNFVDKVKQFQNSSSSVTEAKVEADKKTANDIIDFAIKAFNRTRDIINDKLEKSSRLYWENKTRELRDVLINIISGSDAIPEENRNELERIIIDYKEPVFSNEYKFDIEEFDKKFRILQHELIISEKLNLRKLSNRYNEEIEKATRERLLLIEDYHLDSVKKWLSNLMDKIGANIVSYNPELSKLEESIERQTVEINKLIDKRSKLIKYSEQLEKMMNWQEIEGE